MLSFITGTTSVFYQQVHYLRLEEYIHTISLPDQAQAYGGSSAQNEITTGIWGLISGDNNGNGTIDNNDKTTDWDLNVGTSGLQSADLNLDGQVDNRDKDDKWLPNIGKGILYSLYKLKFLLKILK